MRDDVAECHTHTGPCVYDPLTWNIILTSPALNSSMMRSGYWRQKVNYHWLDFIKVDLRNWGLSQSRDGMRRRRRRRNWRRCHHFTSLISLHRHFISVGLIMCKWNQNATDAAVFKTCGTWDGKKNWWLPQLVIEWNKCAHWKYSKQQHRWQHLSAQVQQIWHHAVISQTQRSQIQKGAWSVGKTRVAPSERCTTPQVADRSGLLWNTLSRQEKLMQLVCQSQMDSNLFLQWFYFEMINTRTPPAHHTSHSPHLFSFFSSITSPHTATPGPSMFNLFPATVAPCEDGVATDGTTKHLMRLQYAPI